MELDTGVMLSNGPERQTRSVGRDIIPLNTTPQVFMDRVPLNDKFDATTL
jgi:hypothetical protein